MFDIDILPSIYAVVAADDPGLVDAIGEAARLEAATMARRLAAVAELYHRRLRKTPNVSGWPSTYGLLSARK